MPACSRTRFHFVTPRWSSSTYASRRTSFIALRRGTSRSTTRPSSITGTWYVAFSATWSSNFSSCSRPLSPAAKYSAARLEELLAGFLTAAPENLLVGLSPADDAAVYRLDDERALVFTTDFFPPLVDDPSLFGAIAAANALNDVFAMGGRPLVALSIAAFPEELAVETVRAIFDAAAAKVEEDAKTAGLLK